MEERRNIGDTPKECVGFADRARDNINQQQSLTIAWKMVCLDILEILLSSL